MYKIGVRHGHPLVAWAVHQLLETDPEFEVYDIDDGVTAAEQLDLLITDNRPPPEGPTDGAEPSRATKVLVLSRSGQPGEAGRLPAEAAGHIDEKSGPAVLLAAARRAVDPDRPAGPGPGRQRLSPREQEVLAFISGGLTHEQIARRLAISPHTVDTYVKRVRGKLGVGNKAELTRAALAHGWGRRRPLPAASRIEPDLIH